MHPILSRTSPLLLFFLLIANTLTAQDKKIIAIHSSQLSLYEEAAAGFRDCLKSLSIPFSLENQLMPKDESALDGFFSDVKAKTPDLILAVGSSAARYAREKIKNTPIIFCMVIDPATMNLTEAGVSLDVAPAVQVDYIRKNFPQFKKIGVIYNAQRNKEIIKGLKELKQQGTADIVFVEVTAIDQVNNAVKSVKNQADCLLMISDSLIYTQTTISQIIFDAIQMGLPIFTVSPALVKAGALAAVYSDSKENGCSAVEIARKVFAGESPKNIPISWPVKTKSAVNMVVAERLGIQVKPATLEKAEQVIR